MFYSVIDNETKPIYTASEILEIFSNTLKYYENKVDASNKAAQKTRDEVIKEIMDEYKKEKETLKKELSLSYGSLNSEYELNLYHNFIKDHMKSCYSKQRSSRDFYIKPYHTGFGVGHIVCCPICSAEKDITDVSAW